MSTEDEDLRGAIRTLLRLHSVESVLKAVASEAGLVEQRPRIERNARGERLN